VGAIEVVRIVGSLVGASVGRLVFGVVGFVVGTSVANTVGTSVGRSVGLLVGLPVGLSVKASNISKALHSSSGKYEKQNVPGLHSSSVPRGQCVSSVQCLVAEDQSHPQNRLLERSLRSEEVSDDASFGVSG